MNSANVHNPMQSDQGMEVRKPYLARGFKHLTSGELKERWCCTVAPAVAKSSTGSTRTKSFGQGQGLRSRCPSLHRWEVIG